MNHDLPDLPEWVSATLLYIIIGGIALHYLTLLGQVVMIIFWNSLPE